jgi:ribose 1,5-bisphosphokinase
VITRPEVAGGEPFEGVSAATFAARQAAGEFALHWEAHGLHYGVPPVPGAAQGKTVIFNASRAVLAQAARAFPGLQVIEITARPEVLAERLMARGRESRADILRRLSRQVPPLPADLTVQRVDNSGALGAGVAALVALLQPVSLAR